MAFLHGVLSNIQPHLGLHRNTIDEAISFLNANKHRGKDGFNKAIGKVVEGVKGYNEGVRRSNESVSKPTKRLYDFAKKGGMWSNEVNDMQVSIGTEQEVERSVELVTQCVKDALKFNDALNVVKHPDVKNAINDLSPSLTDRVHRLRESLQRDTETLKDYYQKKEGGNVKYRGKEKEKLDEMVTLIENKFEKLAEGVNRRIKNDVEILVKLLKEKVKSILQQLKAIEKSLRQYFDTLAEWISKAEKLVTGASAHIDKILDEVKNNPMYPNRGALEAAVLQLRGKAEELLAAGKDARQKAQDELKTALKAVNSMNSTLRMDLNTVKGQIQSGIREYVGNLKKVLEAGMTDPQNMWVQKAEKGVTDIKQALQTGDLKTNLGSFGVKLETVIGKATSTNHELGQYIENVLYDLKQISVKWNDNPDLAGAISADLTNELEKELPDGGINVDITRRADILKTYKDHVSQEHLTALMNGIMPDGNKNPGELPKAIKKIEEKVTSALVKIDTIEPEIQSAFGQVESDLNALCNAIANECTFAKFSLKELKEKYFREGKDYTKEAQESVKKIKHDINILLIKDLQAVIKDAEAFEGYANKAEKHYVDILTKYVNERVTESRSVIVKAVRKQYVTKVKALLAAFSKRITDELHDLPTAITKDSDKNYKGFMKVLSTKLTSSKLSEMLPREAKLDTLSPKVHAFFVTLLDALETNRDVMPETKIADLQNKLAPLFTDLTKYNRKFVNDLTALNTLLTEMHPDSYSAPSNPLLDILKTGVQGLHDELKKAYVSAYDGEPWYTEHENKYAKICFTCLPTLTTALTELYENCKSDGGWKTKTICEFDSNNIENPLGAFLRNCGYDVAEKETSKNGELKFPSTTFVGQKIYEKLNEAVATADATTHLTTCQNPKKIFNVTAVLDCLKKHLNEFYKVGHHSTFTSRRHPCSVYEMLAWSTGLPHNRVYASLMSHVKSLFYAPKNAGGSSRKQIAPINAYPYAVTLRDVENAIAHVISYSRDMLTTIVGPGDANCRYACDYSNNTLNLHYPADPSQCLGMFIDILRRILPPFRFMLGQCGLRPEHNGWAACLYGRDVKPSKWAGEEHLNDKPTGRPTGQPNCQSNDQPKFQPNCEPTSPLQSYLTDTLVGHMPHQLQSVGCTAKCTTCSSSSRHMPCLTPLGFRAFSGSTRTGFDLHDLLYGFLSNPHLASLLCLSPKAPVTLPEHISFAYSFVTALNDVSKYPIIKDVETSIRARSIDLCEDPRELTGVLTDAYGSDAVKHGKCKHAHVMNLTNTGICQSAENAIDCAPGISSVCRDAYRYLAQKNCDAYLSWALYLPWEFYSYLERLLEAFTHIFCEDWGCRNCLNGKCQRGRHGNAEQPCHCTSMVNCRGVSPTLYKYGFTFDDAWLTRRGGKATTCSDFNKLLTNVLKSEYFTKLFDACDKFIFIIRAPFIWTLLSLWSLSLLYLLHILVVRLDVLRIRSHLRSPSSHRIAAQSLLAVAKVGEIANVKYFSP
ncbi:hypothetical protein, conserved [Babesia ovata]|uniref:C3H1-type domain-containing protein n=1 Tax=Babesia ovata TaxID=189622 RepID=A0A2H6KJE3_9APIC|nr:uncharacterized protein BOVATA_046000 [Babesia ovata]GBE63107.1 hypothetical protein, conserved [Babesia ovata]